MSSGYFCDDTNDAAPGNEETMINQTAKPDYYRYTLEVPLATEPGVNAVYCSASANLALGMLGRAAGMSPLYTFDKLVAQPLKIRNYLWPLDPAGQPYGGGSVALLPRDFLKLGQLMLNGGRWNGRQILSPEFVRRGTSSLYHLRNVTYGYLWWIETLPYKNRTVRAFAALGSGGQSVTVVPELDLVVATLGGNYFTAKQAKEITLNLVPRSVLPAVLEPGDPPKGRLSEIEYSSPYGASKDGSRVTQASHVVDSDRQ
jgi:CubicO group peptidase (beta-lactamase class C family)